MVNSEPNRRDGTIRFGSARRRGGRAFTLIEIMLVVAILALVLFIGIPAIHSATHRDPMTQAIVDITEACRRARTQAILTGNTTAMHISAPLRTITVDSPAAPPPKPEDLQNGDSTATNSAEPGFSAQISDDLSIRMLDVNFLDCLQWDSAAVYFNPNGTCDEFNIILVGGGQAKRLVLDITTSCPDVINIE